MKITIILFIASIITRFGYSQPLAENSNTFGIDLYQQGENTDNRCFSPYSLFRCLSLAYLGAQNTTKKQMEHVLHLSVSSSDLPLYFSDLQKNLSNAQVKIADALWLMKGSSLLPTYQAALEEMQGAVEEIDFKNTPTAVKTINSWVSDQTQGTIPNLLSIRDISPATELILTNTVFFEGCWAFPFAVNETYTTDFFGQNKTVPVQMMHKLETLSYHENDLCQVLLLPIARSSCSCFFILPKHSIEEVENSLASLNFWLSHTKHTLINLDLPKFQLKQSIKVRDVLCKLGMEEAFSLRADFSGMSQNYALHLDQVIHEAFFSVEEKGVKAGAATAISVAKSCVFKPKKPISFTANHPFLFGIVDENSTLVLFLGKLSNP